VGLKIKCFVFGTISSLVFLLTLLLAFAHVLKPYFQGGKIADKIISEEIHIMGYKVSVITLGVKDLEKSV
jgi:uncharacterized membrane protein